MTQRMAALIATLVLTTGAANSAGEASDDPDMEMLEFIGSWQAEDEDWLAVSIEDVEFEQERASAPVEDDEGVEAADDEP